MPRAIVLIVIDCLRADHVSAYGYGRATTPTLDGLARKGTLWRNAYSVTSWTKPAVTSLMTGLYPHAHGVYQGIKRSKGDAGSTTDALSPEVPTLAEALSRHGWRCGAFMDNEQLGTFSGLARGFDAYIPTAGKADNIIELWADWMQRDVGKPAFTYLHFLEAHWPYKPRRRHVALFDGSRDTNRFREFSARDYAEFRRHVRYGGAPFSDADLGQMVDLYDAAVRRLDGKLKVILRRLGDLGLHDDSAVIVTADHGEEFFDHGDLGHGRHLYEEVLHVPLIMHGPHLPAGPCCGDPVSLTDLPATLLDVAGLPADLPGRNLLGPARAAAPVFAELSVGSRYVQTVRRGNWKLHRQFTGPRGDGTSPRPSPQARIRAGGCRLHQELYDLQADPGEKTDRAGDALCRETVRELAELLDNWCPAQPSTLTNTEDRGKEAAWRAATPVEVSLDAGVVERIRNLGYID